MKVSKITITISLVTLLLIIIVITRFAYSIGQRNATLTVTSVTPKELAEAMQSDDFYGKYTQTMLLVTGTVQVINKQGTNTLVQFEVTKSATALGKVTCNMPGNQSAIKVGDAIRALTVAHDAKRKNTSDVLMPNCYILNL